MIKFSNIIEGWRKYFFIDPETEEVALKRLEICETCDSNPDKPKIKLSSRCNECGCFLEAKVRSLDEECPLKLWHSYQQTKNG